MGIAIQYSRQPEDVLSFLCSDWQHMDGMKEDSFGNWFAIAIIIIELINRQVVIDLSWFEYLHMFATNVR